MCVSLTSPLLLCCNPFHYCPCWYLADLRCESHLIFESIPSLPATRPLSNLPSYRGVARSWSRFRDHPRKKIKYHMHLPRHLDQRPRADSVLSHPQISLPSRFVPITMVILNHRLKVRQLGWREQDRLEPSLAMGCVMNQWVSIYLLLRTGSRAR